MRKLLITIDSLRFDHFRHMEHTRDFIDHEHRNAYATFPSTLGSFPAIINGEYAITPGVTDTVARNLDGYKIGITSNHLVSPRYGYDTRFDHFEAPSVDDSLRSKLSAKIDMGGSMYKFIAPMYNIVSSIRWMGRQPPRTFRPAEDIISTFLDKIDDKDEFFGFLHLMGPHHPYEPEYNRLKYQKLSRKALAGRASMRDRGLLRSAYRDEIIHLDNKLAYLWDQIPEDTEIIVCADHGEMLGAATPHIGNTNWGHQGELNSQLLHVPFGVKNIDVQFGDIFSLIDIPTVLLGYPYGQGRTDRTVAFAAYGKERAAMNEDGLVTTYGHEEGNPSHDLYQALDRFDISTGLTREDALKSDLEVLGYK